MRVSLPNRLPRHKFHPYFQFQEILKPNYNSVDLAEVELIHDYKNPQAEPRSNDTELLAVRPGIFS